MKDRIEKFYNDHKTVILSVAAGAAIGGGLVAMYAEKERKGYEIRIGELLHAVDDNDEDKYSLRIHYMNGDTQDFKQYLAN